MKMIRTIYNCVFVLLITVLIILPIIALMDVQLDNINSNKNPMEQPIIVKIKRKKIGKNIRLIYYDNRYTQYQLKKNGKWVLHNLNGPAVIDKFSNRKNFFVNGFKCDNELQYLVAKGDYENG